MNTSPTIKAAHYGSGMDTATARLLLQHFFDTLETSKRDEITELERKRLIKKTDGASLPLPSKTSPAHPEMPTWDKTDLVSSPAAPTAPQ